MNPRTLAILAAMLALVCIIFMAASGFDPFGTRKAAETRADTAEVQAEVATTTTQVLDRVLRSEITIRSEAAGAVEHVEQAQGADQPLPAAVGDAVRAGVERLRDPAGAGADQPAAEPESPL